uniref:Eukaryotic translation initiation factor 3 subunit G n=1 Tax=Noccaea caerulescens TaxID=107243 RepID=A0A1J3HML4_NOCCA
MAIVSQQRTNKFLWGDMVEDDDFDILLPPKQVIGPNQTGIKKVIEYKLNDEGKKVKTTTTLCVVKRALNKQAVERRSWLMFGDAAKKDADSCLTMRSTEDVILERIRAPGFKAEEAKPSGDTMSGAVLMVCRLCLVKGDRANWN